MWARMDVQVAVLQVAARGFSKIQQRKDWQRPYLSLATLASQPCSGAGVKMGNTGFQIVELGLSLQESPDLLFQLVQLSAQHLELAFSGTSHFLMVQRTELMLVKKLKTQTKK